MFYALYFIQQASFRYGTTQYTRCEVHVRYGHKSVNFLKSYAETILNSVC
jgi:hypothetical protein